MGFPTRLKKARLTVGYNRQRLTQHAAIAGQSSIAEWEDKKRIPRLDAVEKIAYSLGLSPAFLAYGIDADASQPTSSLHSEGVASRVRQMRIARGLSVLAVATAAGLSHTAVGNVERGTMPGLDTAEALAVALGVSPAWLAYGLGPMELPSRRRRAAAATQEPDHG